MRSPIRVLSFVLAAALASAQQTSVFAEVAYPGGVPSGVNSLGKLVHLVDGTTLRVWSASTRSWHATPVAVGATTYATNDFVLARAPGTWIAFGASRGRFAPLSVSANAVLVNPTSQNNDSVALVREGSSLHAFSGFTGRWTTRTVPPSAGLAVSRHTALLVDGVQLSGFDAFTGQWLDHLADGPLVRLSADGVCGFAATATSAYGFSALHRAWSTAAANGSTTLVRNDDWAVLHDGTTALGYSGLTNTFASVVTGPLLASAGDDLMGTLTVPGLVFGYSAMTGTFAPTPFSTGSVRVTTAAALVLDGPQLVAFSAPLGTWTALAVTSGGELLAGAVLAAVDQVTGGAHLFSALTGQWHAAPNDAAPGLPRLSTTGALLTNPTGAYAFSARSGAFVPLVDAGLVFEGNENSSPLFAWSPQSVHVFDGRADRWRSLVRTGTGAVNTQIWRTCGFAQDGGEVFAFSAAGGTLARANWNQALLSFRANSESSSLVGPTSLLAISGVPETVPLAQFPDFRRVTTVGAPFVLHLALPQGSAALLGFGPGLSQPVSLAGLGELWLDPSAVVTTFVLPEADAERAVFSATVPNDPSLRGQSVWFQPLIAPASGAAFLGDASTLWIG